MRNAGLPSWKRLPALVTMAVTRQLLATPPIFQGGGFAVSGFMGSVAEFVGNPCKNGGPATGERMFFSL
jgi:hypothetical protein